jgi:hypothetical protein
MPRWLGKASYRGLAAAAGWVPICLSIGVLIANGGHGAVATEWFEPRARELWTMVLPGGSAIAFVCALAASGISGAFKPRLHDRRRRPSKIDIRKWAEGIVGTPVELDGSCWASKGDFYDALLPALGAPAWHGRNLDALSESLRSSRINEMHPPYTIRIRGLSTMQPDAREMVSRFANFIAARRAEGIAVGLVVE